MAKKKSVKKGSRKKSATHAEDNEITPDKLLGYFTVAYVVDTAGMLDPLKRERLDSLQFPGCPSWEEAVEEEWGITRTFVRNVLTLCTEIKPLPAAVLFILRGLGCPDYQARLQEVMDSAR